MGARRFRWRYCLAPVLLLTLADCAGGVGECGFGKEAVLPMEQSGRLAIIPVVVDGAPARLILDTGASVTMLTSGAASRMQLGTTRSVTALTGVAGSMRHSTAQAKEITFGNVVVDQAVVAVAGFSAQLDGIDGLLGRDILSLVDLDIDMPRKRVVFHQGQLCEGQPPPELAAWTEVPAARAGQGGMRRHDPGLDPLLLTVRVNGVDMTALIDTGATLTSITPEAALRAGVDATQLARDPTLRIHGVGTHDASARIHLFRDARLGTLQVDHPLFAVVPLPDRQLDMLLGMDFLQQHRLWLSQASGRVFVAPRTTGAMILSTTASGG